MPVVTAFSVSEQITNVGAYAGLASILGLAVLSLLYFGQARELKRLRDWAGRAPERTAELQEQAIQQAGTSAQSRPAPQAAGVPASRPAAATSASASVRAVPATQAATAAGAAVASPAASQAPPVPGTPVPGPGAPASAPPPGATPEAGPVTWAPSQATATGAPANGVGQDTQAIPTVPPAASDTPLPEAVPSVAASVPIGPDGPPTDDNPVPLRQVNAAVGAGQPRRRTAPEPAAPEASQRNRGTDGPRGRRVGLLAGGAVVLLLVIVLATQVLGAGGDSPSKKASTPAENTIVPPGTSATTGAAPAVNPGDYQVYVLNGTIQNGIAAEFAKTLETAGYRSAGTGNAAVSTVPTTEVFYVAGKKKGASAVAKKLGVKAASVKPADPNVTALAQDADVIVQIGADKATP